jgi:branched-chain amino acid transport system substrate-binding protein
MINTNDEIPKQTKNVFFNKKVNTYERFTIPHPGWTKPPTCSNIVRRMRADWVVSHLFGKSPSISIRELKKNGYPLNKVVSLVWGAGEQDMIAAGWDTAQGYLGMHFAGVGQGDHPDV